MALDLFDLKAALANWRTQMISSGITKTADLDELESHLLEDFDKLIDSGLSDSKAFVTATKSIGQPTIIKSEFKKVEQKRKFHALGHILLISAVMLALATMEKSNLAMRFVLIISLVSNIQSALIDIGNLNYAKLVRLRPYALIANFIFAALLAGPGIIFQATMALILQLLFECDVRNTRLRERHVTAARD